MPANTAAATITAVDGSVPTLPFEARPMDSVKIDSNSGFNAAAFGLNPMSADDPSWIGHGFQAQAAEDFLSSPDWTDPSPALTDSMSFEIDSCGPSPLLPLDSYENDLGVPGIAGAPLFPPMDGYASSNVSPLELSNNDFGASNTVGDFGAPEMSSDFSLFPETTTSASTNKAVKLPVEMAFSKLGKPAAGSASTEDPAITLLRALSSAALSNSATTASVAVPTSAVATSAPALTASPLAFTSMTAPPALAPAPAPVAPASTPVATSEETKSYSPVAMDRRISSSSSNKTTDASSSRGTKRRLDSTDLLPLDAPIQKRTYYTVSATSRRDTAASAATEVDEFAAEEAIRREKDPRVAKRLSNTLAARRSRRRKAEELRLLHEKIEALSGEVESWKRRCELAEKERDDARALLALLKMSTFFRQGYGLLRSAPARSSLISNPTRLTAAPVLNSWSRLLSTEARSKIDSAVKSNPLVVFMKGTPDMPMCGFSRAVIQVMQVQGVKPELLKTFNCLEDQELREGIKEYSDWPTIPQVYVGGEFVGGCDILINMHQSGELEELLLKHNLLLPLEENKNAQA
ncbi:hypothetical protein NDA16_002072 [Ustilago loliicola]|nr:hypothetical protein NDA16_002072 [Ustilago loliicola]